MSTEVITQKEIKPILLYLANLLHPSNNLVNSRLKKHKELENRTVPIKQSCKPSQHPSLMWEKCRFGVVWSRFR